MGVWEIAARKQVFESDTTFTATTLRAGETIGSGLVPATAGLQVTCSHLDLGLRGLHKAENAYQEDLNLAKSCPSNFLAGDSLVEYGLTIFPPPPPPSSKSE